MGRIRFKLGKIDINESKKKRTRRRLANLALVFAVCLSVLNLAWDISSRQKQVQKLYQSIEAKALELKKEAIDIYVNLQK